MNKAGKILQVDPPNAIEGGEIAIECEGFTLNREGEFACYIGGKPARLTAASSTRVLAVVPENENGGKAQVYLKAGVTGANRPRYWSGKSWSRICISSPTRRSIPATIRFC